MSVRTKFGERTINGLNRADFDELNVAGEIDSLTIDDNEGSAGQVLSKNPITNKLEFNAVPIADNTITTNMIQDLQITNEKIANTTIEGGKLATDIAISTTGNISCDELTTTGDTTLGNAVDDVLSVNGVVNFNSTIAFLAEGGSSFAGTITATACNIGSHALFVNAVDGANFGKDTSFGGDMEMVVDGAETFDFNGHRIVDAGGISLTNTGGAGHDATGDITGVNAITATTANIGTLNLSTALSLSNIDIDNTPNGDISTKSITADAVVLNTIAGITATGGINPTINIGTGIISCGNLACNELWTANNDILFGTGEIKNTGSTLLLDGTNGNITCAAINTSNNNINAGTGDLTCDTIGCGPITSTTINTQNNTINAGTGSLTANGGINTTGSSVMRGISCREIDTNDNNITTGTGDLTTDVINANIIRNKASAGSGLIEIYTTSKNIVGEDAGGSFQIEANGVAAFVEVKLDDGGLTTTGCNLSIGESQAIEGFNTYNKYNDMPRILACKSFTANHPYTRTINTSYQNIDRDTTTLNCAFDVPPSCKILVEIGFYVGTDLSNERLHLRLVNSAGNEFWTTYINNVNHGHTTDRTEVQYASSYGSRSQMVITKLFFSFPTTARGDSVNLQPQLITNTGTATLYCGGTPASTTDSTPPMYVKVESLGSTSSFNWHYELDDGSDDY
jgi:hypothetical protein